VDQLDGEYLTMGQSVYATRIVQGSLFAFEDVSRTG